VANLFHRPTSFANCLPTFAAVVLKLSDPGDPCI